MFIEVTVIGSKTSQKWVINVYSIALVRPNPEGDGTRISFNSNESVRYLDIKESYEDVKKCLEKAMEQLSKRILLN